MKRISYIGIALVIGLILVVSGCTGGGTSTTQATTTQHSTTTTHTTTTEHTSAIPTHSPSSTHSTSISSTTSTTPSMTETYTSTTQTQTTSTTTQTTSTQTPVEEAFWKYAWKAAPFEINGKKYLISYYKYKYKIQPNQSAPIYEYIIEKSFEKTKVHVYGQDMSGNKVDIGEKEVYAYKTVVTPVKGAALDDVLTFTIWFVSNNSQAFIYPWDVLWMGYLSPYNRDKNFVGMEFGYKGEKLLITSPLPYRSDLFPYFEGNQEAFGDIAEDLCYLYMGWVATTTFGIWYEWSDVNVLIPQSGTWSDMQGHSWEWSTKPDGTVEFSGMTFKLVDFQWKYKGTAEEVSMNGRGKFSPYLPLPIETEGYFSSKDSETGKETIIYAYLKLEGLKLEKVGE